MDPSLFAAFLVVDLMLVMTPGADWAYAITAGIRGRTIGPTLASVGDCGNVDADADVRHDRRSSNSGAAHEPWR